MSGHSTGKTPPFFSAILVPTPTQVNAMGYSSKFMRRRRDWEGGNVNYFLGSSLSSTDSARSRSSHSRTTASQAARAFASRFEIGGAECWYSLFMQALPWPKH